MDWSRIADVYRAVADHVFGTMQEDIEAVSAEIAGRMRAGGTLMVCGNGGSAADAQHIAGEMINRFLVERRPYASIALSTDTSVMTAIGNDYDYSEIFSKQVEGLGRSDDILLGISTSGNAKNVCRAVESANRIGMLTVALTGGTGGELAPLCQRVLSISCTQETPRIQEGHHLVFHLVCERIEEILVEADRGGA